MTAARSDVRALIDRYAMLGDRGRTDELAALFAEDGVLKTGSWEADGRDEIAKQLSRQGDRNPALTIMRHHITTCDIETKNAAEATARSYFLVVTNAGLDRAGVYIDRFGLDAGQWRFVRREVRIDWIASGSLLPMQPVRHAGQADMPSLPM